jgi:hypothetical protein
LVNNQFDDAIGFFIDSKPIDNCTNRPGFAIICTMAVTKADTNTIGTAGVASLHFFGNQALIPINDTHLMLAGKSSLCLNS